MVVAVVVGAVDSIADIIGDPNSGGFGIGTGSTLGTSVLGGAGGDEHGGGWFGGGDDVVDAAPSGGLFGSILDVIDSTTDEVPPDYIDFGVVLGGEPIIVDDDWGGDTVGGPDPSLDGGDDGGDFAVDDFLDPVVTVQTPFDDLAGPGTEPAVVDDTPDVGMDDDLGLSLPGDDGLAPAGGGPDPDFTVGAFDGDVVGDMPGEWELANGGGPGDDYGGFDPGSLDPGIVTVDAIDLPAIDVLEPIADGLEFDAPEPSDFRQDIQSVDAMESSLDDLFGDLG